MRKIFQYLVKQKTFANKRIFSSKKGASTLRLMTFGIMTLRVMTVKLMTRRMMALGLTTSGIKALSIKHWNNDSYLNNTQNNGNNMEKLRKGQQISIS